MASKTSGKDEAVVAGMSTGAMIQIGVTGLALAGLGFWMYSKSNALEAHMEAIEKKMKDYESIMTNQGQIITAHENHIKGMYNVLVQHGIIVPQAQPQQQPQTPVHSNSKSNKKQPKKSIKIPIKNPKQNPSKPKRNVQIKKKTRVISESSSEEESESSVDSDELDDELEDELAELDCEDGLCKVPGSKKK
jgi:hypothetical protein